VGHFLPGNAPEDFLPELDVGQLLVEHQLAHHFDDFDGALPGFLASPQQLLASLLGFGVHRGDEFVLSLDDGIGRLRKRCLEEAHQHGVALWRLEAPQVPGVVVRAQPAKSRRAAGWTSARGGQSAKPSCSIASRRSSKPSRTAGDSRRGAILN
jgi:hypothetical protein